MARLTQEAVIARFRAKHGSRYDYSLVEYEGTKTPHGDDAKVNIICSIHGAFEQSPVKHWHGTGCPTCAIFRGRLTQEQVLVKFLGAHKTQYDYSLVKYVTKHAKVTIVCRKHGHFEQTPASHWGGRGCPICANNIKLTPKGVLKRFRKVHGDHYDYSQVAYVGAMLDVKIVCPDHGMFEQMALHHWRGSNCPVCTGNRKLAKKEVLKRFHKTHGETYDYSLMSYVGLHAKVEIICALHGMFEQRVFAHASGAGCPGCSISGFDQTRAATFYYARINRRNQKPLYMVGITNLSFEKRYHLRDREHMTLLGLRHFTCGRDALAFETKVKQRHAGLVAKEPSPLESKGSRRKSSEIFHSDILRLDLGRNNFRSQPKELVA